MYDSQNERKEFVGQKRDEAIQKACQHFGVEADALVVTEFASGEVYGLSARSVVVAVPRDAKAPSPDSGPGARGRSRGDSDGGGRGERSERGGRGGGGGGRDRERGGRDRGRGSRDGRDRDRDRDRDRGERDRDRTPRSEAPKSQEPSVATVKGEINEIGRYLAGVLERMDFGPFEISETLEGDHLIFEVRGDAARELAANDSRAIDALQLLTNQAALQADDEAPRVVVDFEGNEDARETQLTRLAERGAARATETTRAVALDPMNGHDRRIIHIALRDHEGIATMSLGEGRYRRVVVVPEGAPEYDEALRESSSAGNDD